jgi:hypothetical protein
LVVDEAQITEVASAYCREQGQSAAGEDFWLGYLPLEAIDDLGAEEIAPEAARVRLGSLYLSGFFGGVWLRDNYFFPGGVTGSAGVSASPGGGLAFQALARSGAGLLAVTESGSPEEVLAAARAILPFFLMLYGYNQGYYETLSAHPPAGYTPPEAGLKCRGFLDCEDPTVKLSVLDRYRPVREKLTDPDTPGWEELARLALRWGEEATRVGGGVWENFLSGSGMEPGTFRLVSRLSSGYILVAGRRSSPWPPAWRRKTPSRRGRGSGSRPGSWSGRGVIFTGCFPAAPTRGAFRGWNARKEQGAESIEQRVESEEMGILKPPINRHTSKNNQLM